MEVIKNVIWGSSDQHHDTTDDTTTESYKQEPISGVQGDTSKGEPFDAGNMNPQPTSTSASSLHDNKETTTSDSHLSPPSNAATAGPSSTTSEPTAESNLTAHKEPSTKMQTDPSSTENVTQDHPAATDDNDEPEVDISGPGPRPISQVAAEHGGNMPEPESASASTSTSTSISNSDRGSKKTGSEESGGDKYVSSGFAATGGNFDAAHSGAGPEALRLMHKPGQHKTYDEVKEEEKKHHHHHPKLHMAGHDGNKHSGEHVQPQTQSIKNGDVQTADHGGNSKVSLGEKLKNKLHIRSKDKESASTTA